MLTRRALMQTETPRHAVAFLFVRGIHCHAKSSDISGGE
jgi:hypothetical protein